MPATTRSLPDPRPNLTQPYPCLSQNQPQSFADKKTKSDRDTIVLAKIPLCNRHKCRPHFFLEWSVAERRKTDSFISFFQLLGDFSTAHLLTFPFSRPLRAYKTLPRQHIATNIPAIANLSKNEAERR